MPIREAVPNGAPIWIDLASSNPDQSSEFYQQLFGWTAEGTGPDFGDYVNFFKNGVLVAGLMAQQQPGTPDAWTTYLASPDAEATANAVTAAGGQVLLPPLEVMQLGTMAVVADPGGAVIGVWQAREHHGYGLVREHGAPSWLELQTRDYRACVAFYESAFSWHTEVLGDTDEFRYSVLEKDGDQYAGIMDGSSYLPADIPPRWDVYFHVSDVDASAATVEELGGSVVDAAEDTPYGRIAAVADPTGARFRLMTPPAATS